MSGKKTDSVQALEDLYLETIKQEKSPDASTSETADYKQPEILPQDTTIARSGEAGPEDTTPRPVIELMVSPDKMAVTLAIKGGRCISALEITATLEKLGVVHGIDEQAVSKAEIVSLDKSWQGEITVARGSLPEYKKIVVLPDLERRQRHDSVLWLSGGFQFDFLKLEAIMGAKDLKEIELASVRVKAVMPGDILAQVEDNPSALAGKDVFGAIIETREEPLPKAGENISSARQSAFTSLIFGYLFIKDDTLSVLPPVWISPDKMSAYYLNLAQVGVPRYPDPQHLVNLLSLMGVKKECVKIEIIKQMCAKMRAGKLPSKIIEIAAAVQPVAGRNAEFSLCLDLGKKSGTLRDDGTLDMRERNAVVSVPEGTLIARKVMMTKGINGFNLFGKTLKAINGFDRYHIQTDANVRAELKDNTTSYFAKKTGNVCFARNYLSISDVFEVKGDVDYNTGNLDVKTSLLIRGSVLSGFKVKAKGNVEIIGSIENGATVIAEGDLSVDKGIMGADTKVLVLGRLRTTFIQDAEVLVRGDTIIDSYLYNCTLRSYGSIAILKGQGKKSGRVTGGLVSSSKEISLSSGGSPSNIATVLEIKPEPELCGQVDKLAEEEQTCKDNIAKITRTLPFDSFAPEQIKTFMNTLDSKRKAMVVKLLTNLNNLIKHQKILHEQRGIIRAQIDKVMYDARIRVTEMVIQGCEIRLGDNKLLIREDLGPSVFELRDGNITI